MRIILYLFVPSSLVIYTDQPIYVIKHFSKKLILITSIITTIQRALCIYDIIDVLCHMYTLLSPVHAVV